MSVSYATEAQQPGRIGKEVAIPKRNQAQISPLISLVSGGVAGAVEASITVSIVLSLVAWRVALIPVPIWKL